MVSFLTTLVAGAEAAAWGAAATAPSSVLRSTLTVEQPAIKMTARVAIMLEDLFME
jgi:hypothetical protein